MKKIPYSFFCQTCNKHSEKQVMKFEGRSKRAFRLLGRGKYCKCGSRYASIHFYNEEIIFDYLPF